MKIVETGMIACWALCAAGLAAYAASVAREITYVTLADGRKTERRLPLVMRLLLARFAPDLGVTAYDVLLICSGLAAILGHLKSPYLHFTGGKGAATAFGVLVVIMPLSAIVVAVVWFALVFITRIVSIATMVAALTLPFTCPVMHPGHPVYMVLSVLIVVLIIVAHRSNIKRLMHGEEKKLTFGHAERKSHTDND